MAEITPLDRAEAKLRDYAKTDITSPDVLSALGTVLEVLDDARRWQALLGAARLRPLGWAGLDREGKMQPDATYVHFGMEFWTHHSHDADNERGRQVLTSFVEMAMAGENPAAAVKATEDEEAGRMRDAAIILGKEMRKVVMLLPQVGLAEAIALSGRPNMGEARVIRYLRDKGLIEPAGGGALWGLSVKGAAMRAYLLDVFDEAWAEGT